MEILAHVMKCLPSNPLFESMPSLELSSLPNQTLTHPYEYWLAQILTVNTDEKIPLHPSKSVFNDMVAVQSAVFLLGRIQCYTSFIG